MVDYLALYTESLKAIYRNHIRTGSDLLQYLIATDTGRQIYDNYPYRDVEEIIFYNLDCLITDNLVTGIELPRLDKRIYAIDGLTNKGFTFLQILENPETKEKIKSICISDGISINSRNLHDFIWHYLL
ncbi:Uncharacterised protein [Streptococcus acidominimus]|uniref:Uncharacterized protein n=1 Tax=Streptococcus acidominimus TaxID=1326 RepID=A0A239X0V7_STRAI|nr:hypothetical protein [Streptococcus acidominimus]SNV39678.1 Uncharacterised protein [Streptococcus acidominimus]